MELYIVYEMNYNDLILEGCEPANIVGVFDSLEKANKCKLEQIEKGKKDGFIIDEEIEDIEKSNCVTMFYEYKDNWCRSYDINIEKQLLQ